jgi:peptidoglycan/LPS O-acetylase OafA/YrhL
MFPHYNNDWVTEMIFVIFVFPFLLALGAGTAVNGWLRNFCVFTGKLSYPLYMTHIWLVWTFGNYLAKVKPDPVNMYITATLVFIGAVLMGYLALRFYDEPIKRWLSKRRSEKAAAVQSYSVSER